MIACARREFDAEAFRKHWTAIKAESSRMVGLSVVDRMALQEQREPGFTDRIFEAMSPIERVRFFFAWRAWARQVSLAFVCMTWYGQWIPSLAPP
jgi:hypothetical protein